MEISDDEINSALQRYNSLPPATEPPKPKQQTLSDEELSALMKERTPPPKKGFWGGVGTAVKGTFRTAGKGLQLEAAEAVPEEDENIRSYQRDLAEAQRRGDTKRVKEFETLIAEAQGRRQQALSAPEVIERVNQLNAQIQAIQDDISGARPQDMGFWKSAAFDAATSVGVMAPALVGGVVTGGASLPLTTMGLVTYANSYGKNRSEGMSRERASQLAAIDGVAEAVTELLPTSSLLKKTGVFRKFLESTIADIPGENVANFVQTATEEVGKLGEDPSDDQIKKAITEAAKKAVEDAPSVSATTAMAGGALAAGTAAVQRPLQRRGRKAPESGLNPEPTEPAAQEPTPQEPAPQEPKKKKPHFKSPKEFQEAMQAQTPAGSEFVDLDELLAEAQKEGKARGEIVDFGEKKRERQSPQEWKAEKERLIKAREEIDLAWAKGDITSQEHTEKRKPLTDQIDEINRRINAQHVDKSPDAWKTPYKERIIGQLSNMQISLDENRPGLKAYREKVKQLDTDFAEGKIDKGDYVLQLTKAQREVLASMGREREAERRRSSLKQQNTPQKYTDEDFDRRLAELNAMDKAVEEVMSDDDLLALYHDSARKRRVAEVAGPAPRQPRLTGDKMTDRRNQTQFLRELRQWAGEMYPMKEGASVTPLKPRGPKGARSLTATDKAPAGETRMMYLLRDLHTASSGMWELLGNRAAKVKDEAKKRGLDPSAATVVSADQILARLARDAKGPLKDIITKIAEFVPPEQQVYFQWVDKGDGLHLPDGSKEDPDVGGIYLREGEVGGGRIYVKVDPTFIRNPSFTRTVLHEIVHAVTFDYMVNNPDSPITQRINQLYVASVRAVNDFIAELEMSGMSGNEIEKALGGTLRLVKDPQTRSMKVETSGHLYGLTNQFEIIAEAYANPVFQQILAKASPRAQTLWQRIKQIFHETVGAIAEALGFNKYDAGLLHQIFDATEELMWAQKNLKDARPRRKKKTASRSVLRSKAPLDDSPYGPERQLKTRPSVEKAVKLLTNAADQVPGVKALRERVDKYLRELKQNVAPETLGPKATQSAAVLSKWIVNQMRNDASFEHQSKTRRDFWEKNLHHAPEFIKAFERGWTPKDPRFAEIAKAYRDWNNRIYAEDQKLGIEYDPHDNYLYHVFKDHDKLADYMERKFGKKWGNPKFMKERAYDLYEEAIKAGFKPLYENPEDIMLARQHASEIAHMKIGALRELREAGLAWEHKPKHVETVAWRSPNGEWFYVHHEAASILHNAWNTQSLWSREGLVGDVFRGAMYLKNRIVPVKLSLSLFHFLHVLTINNATGMLRATKGLFLGNVSPAKWLKEMGKAAFYTDLISSPRFGGRIRAIFRGEIPVDQITPDEALAIQYMIEGGMLPEQSHQYKSNAKVAFANALRRMKGDPTFRGKGKAGLRAAYEIPFAALDWMQHWMFEKWIPSIKTTSYLNEVKTALESDPSLVHDQQRRQIVFHKLAKSVDNRHGEMVYKTMFWNKWIKDTAVVNLLSLGWQMGFIREYGGAIGDLKSIATKQGDLPTKIKAGMLDRPIFVGFYTAQALMYGGLITWAMTGEPPEEWKDYIYPKDGEENKDGSPGRVNTMFYPREFAAIAEHMKADGVIGGLTRTAVNKASGVFGLAKKAWTGVDDFGNEFRDPHASQFEKFVQTMDYVLGEMTPISVGGLQREGVSTRSLIMNISGFNKAPGYATQGPAEKAIRHEWQKYNAKTQTPYEKALYSNDMRELRKLWEEGKDEEFEIKLDEMSETHQLMGKDRTRIRRNLNTDRTPEQTMFRSLTWQQQKRLLDKMSPEDREKYLPYSNRTHLRYNYEEP